MLQGFNILYFTLALCTLIAGASADWMAVILFCVSIPLSMWNFTDAREKSDGIQFQQGDQGD